MDWSWIWIWTVVCICSSTILVILLGLCWRMWKRHERHEINLMVMRDVQAWNLPLPTTVIPVGWDDWDDWDDRCPVRGSMQAV